VLLASLLEVIVKRKKRKLAMLLLFVDKVEERSWLSLMVWLKGVKMELRKGGWLGS
jgi:hypothetical protein